MENIIITSVNLISSLVDVFSSKQLLKQSIYSMELSQMIIQAMWISQSPLMQLPTFNSELCNQCKEIEVEDISDFVNLDERDRNTLLSHLDKENIAKIANVCNRYPEINLEIKFIDDNNNFNLGDNICAEIILNRTLIDNSNNGILTNVYSNYYPKVKEEN
jgi:preprotein translocase subunit Sec63